MRRKLFIALLLMPLAVLAQVTGTVKDANGETIIGANVLWEGTHSGTTTDSEGWFSIRKPNSSSVLVISFLGYVSESLTVTNKNQHFEVVLQEDATQLSEVEIKVRDTGLSKSRLSVLNQDQITAAQLTRAACCNLGESFTSNASVDVNYSDAATGAKQIKLLGLSGTYVQMLTENIPNYRGAAMPFALGYIPGPWMQSIQVSKGTSSVKNGYEALTGQINVEFKKPQAEQSVSANVYYSSKNKFEANFDANGYIGQRWKVGVLGHYEDLSKVHDENEDGFQDMPKVRQYNFQNRWAYMGDNYVFQASLKALKEERNSGQDGHHVQQTGDLYKIGYDVERYEAFTKNAYIFDKEHNSNVALILSGSVHNQDSYFGMKYYNVDESNLYASLMFESEMNKRNSISLGLSLNYDKFDQDYALFPKLPIRDIEKEFVPGAYVQYTYNYDDKLVLMGGVRVDNSNLYKTFVTPRAHLKWMPSEVFSLRATAGKGYRTNHVLAENNFLLASSRVVSIDKKLDQEEAWNYGISTMLDIPVAEEKNLNISAEYYYTDFLHQLVIDQDTNAHQIRFTNLNGKSYSHTFQVEASYPLIEGLELTAAYRYTDVKQTIGGVLREKPLTPRNKEVFSLSYKPGMGIWQFDATLQLNGGGRMPTPDAKNPLWDTRYKGYEQVTAQITRWFRHWSIYVGGENLTGFKQKNPIIAASEPWGRNFDSTMVWGPVDGAMFYVGFRYNFTKY